MWPEALPELVTIALYLSACLSALAVSAKLSGSLTAKRFKLMAVAWLLGVLLAGLKLALKYYPRLRVYLPLEAPVWLGLMVIYVPTFLVTIALISLAALYGRYTS